MCAMKSVCLGSLVFVGSQAARIQTHNAEQASVESDLLDLSSTAIPDNQYVIAWTNRFGGQAWEVERKYKAKLVVPVKCSEKAVWLTVSDVANKDSGNNMQNHCIAVNCETTGEVVAKSCHCPGGPGDSKFPRVIELGDAYLMRKGHYKSMQYKQSDNGLTAVFPNTGGIGGYATEDVASDRGWEVATEDVDAYYTFRKWVTNNDCRNQHLAEYNRHKLPLPRGAAATKECKDAAEAENVACLKEADAMLGKSAWWFKYEHFGKFGNKYGNSFEDVGKKYKACAEFSKEATEEKYKERTEDKRAEKAGFALFGQSWEYQCQEALDTETAEKKAHCKSRAWWCEDADVQQCMVETYLPTKE